MEDLGTENNETRSDEMLGSAGGKNYSPSASHIEVQPIKNGVSLGNRELNEPF